jgi:hypothetical protein
MASARLGIEDEHPKRIRNSALSAELLGDPMHLRCE